MVTTYVIQIRRKKLGETWKDFEAFDPFTDTQLEQALSNASFGFKNNEDTEYRVVQRDESVIWLNGKKEE